MREGGQKKESSPGSTPTGYLIPNGQQEDIIQTTLYRLNRLYFWIEGQIDRQTDGQIHTYNNNEAMN